MTANDIRQALRNRFDDKRNYAIAEEVGLTTGFSNRRLDMIVVDCYESHKFRIDGFEIKISTSDLKHELITPEKHTVFFEYIDSFTIACPAGIVDPLMGMIPETWGILIVNDDGSTRYKRRPVDLHGDETNRDITRGFFASFVRASQRLQPAQEELKAAYNEGYNKAKKEEEWQRKNYYDSVAQNVEKVKAYDEMMNYFWSTPDPQAAIEAFKGFSKLNIENLTWRINSAIKDLNEIKSAIPSIKEKQEQMKG